MILLLLGLFTALFHLAGLTRLPVFSDEAIYLNWAQSALRDPQYLFLPMLDGKPPLHSWLLIPFSMLPDPLWGGRFLSVLCGLLTAVLLAKIVRALHGTERAACLAFLLTSLLPFWFFHAHLALAESLLVLGFALAVLSGIRVSVHQQKRWVLLFALSVGMMFWTKTTAFFLILPLVCIPWLTGKKLRSLATARLAVGGFLGLCLFLLLRVSPLFPDLLKRSTEYSFSIGELLRGEWRYVLFSSLPRSLLWLIWYCTPLALVTAGFASAKKRVLWLMAGLFFLPVWMFGKVLSPRYFFPMMVPLTLLMAFGWDRLWEIKTQWLRLLGKIFLGGSVLWSLIFAGVLVFSPNQTPLVAVDRHQYLEDWSSGHGIPEVRDFLYVRAAQAEVTVGTEGNFGTLPDGLNIYFFRKSFSPHIRIIGVGQPVRIIPDVLLQAAQEGRETYLVVNDNRFLVPPSLNYTILQRYPRPNSGPTLLLLQIYATK